MPDATHHSRPTTLEDMIACMGRLFEVLRDPDQEFTPRPDDVIISPYSKCGTTWLQQTFHTLRTGGDSDYDDISAVVPWIETAPGLGIDLEAEQRARPRGFKSHLPWTAVPKGCRYIVCLRDPHDAAVSLYKFFEGWFFEPGTITLDEFVLEFYQHRANGTSYWYHLASWWRQRDNPDVLLLNFETMKAEPAAQIRRIAAFCDIPLDDELLALTLERSSLQYMKANAHQFNDRMMREKSEQVCLPAGSDSAKVREGRVGGHQGLLSQEASAALDQCWADEIESRFGLRDYQALRDVLGGKAGKESARAKA